MSQKKKQNFILTKQNKNFEFEKRPGQQNKNKKIDLINHLGFILEIVSLLYIIQIL